MILYPREQAPIEDLSRALDAQDATREERHRRVVESLRETAGRSQSAILAALEDERASGAVAGLTSYWIANCIVLEADRGALERLAARTDVSRIERNFEAVSIQPMQPPRVVGPEDRLPLLSGGSPSGIRAIRAPEVWNLLGADGTGALVANLDTGVDGDHPALHDRWRGNRGFPASECWLDLMSPPSPTPVDLNGHGTHVMGILTGLGEATLDSIGVAPGALWIAANALRETPGSASFDNMVIQSYQWFADPDGNPGTVDDVPDVVQNSWRVNESVNGYTDCDSRWWSAMDNLEAIGTVLIFSAGNEGPAGTTIGSPADRATSTLNSFSVGNANASSGSFPFPIHFSSSRGPSGCSAPAGNRIKPEVVAPGYEVYSSLPGGVYGLSTGTSMSGPHVAGIVALMRSMNPNMSVTSIKQALINTARDEGTSGDDNTFGRGFVDAYAAVLQAASGYGTVQGTVTNLSNPGVPIRGAEVRLAGFERRTHSNSAGAYVLLGPPGTWTVEASHPECTSSSTGGVVLVANQSTTRNFSLADTAGPSITNLVFPDSIVPGSTAAVSALIRDASSVASALLRYRIDAGAWQSIAMQLSGTSYQATIPSGTALVQVDFYIEAQDPIGNLRRSPAGAPANVHSIRVSFFADDLEVSRGWHGGLAGDDGTGFWTRGDPDGTKLQNEWFEPSDDHTPEQGAVSCWYTGVSTVQSAPDNGDVDAGCVTVESPSIDLSAAAGMGVLLRYWRWFAVSGSPDATFTVLASSNDGATWAQVEELTADARPWQLALYNLREVVEPTAQVRLRVQACDTGAETLVEAAFDDLELSGFTDPIGLGSLTGSLTNAWNGQPIRNGKVHIVERSRVLSADGAGVYQSHLAPGSYSLEASAPGFALVTRSNVGITAGGTSVQNFALQDVAPPSISNLVFPQSIENPADSVRVSAVIRDSTAIATADLRYRFDEGLWQTLALTASGSALFSAAVPPPDVWSTLDLYFAASDPDGNQSVSPSGAPEEYVRIYGLYFVADNCEDDNGWELVGQFDPTQGRWVRVDPLGTTFQGRQVEPSDDHSPTPGTECYVTGQGPEGGTAGQGDVDGGCVNLRTPFYDLSALTGAIVHYWRWFAMEIDPAGSFKVFATGDGGQSWVLLESITSGQNTWTEVTRDLTPLITLGPQVAFVFQACDNGTDSFLEAAVDDFAIERVGPPTGVEPPRVLESALLSPRPNPAPGSTTIVFRLARSGPARVTIFDAAGRRVRTLADGHFGAGEFRIPWSGDDDQGRRLPGGVYFSRFEGPGISKERRVVLLRDRGGVR